MFPTKDAQRAHDNWVAGLPGPQSPLEAALAVDEPLIRADERQRYREVCGLVLEGYFREKIVTAIVERLRNHEHGLMGTSGATLAAIIKDEFMSRKE